jgi:FKBP-type peptidyl-prolyl cis-trans isomerase
MRKTLILPAVLLAATATVAGAQTGKPASKPAAQPSAPPSAAPATPPAAGQGASVKPVEERASYVIGYNLGRQLKANDIKANTDLIIQGLRDGMGGAKGMLTDAEMQATMQEFQQKVMAQQEVKAKALGEKNKTEGEAFLAKNKTRKEVKTTASGLQYETLKEGTGPSPKPTDTVTVNYKGTLMDGSTFDSSYDRGQPATFVLNQVIPGWTEGVQLMKVGGKTKFYIPSAMGYGDKGAGAAIGPNAPLIFEVELISIGAPQTEGGPAADGAPEATQPAKPAKPPAGQKPPTR